ncbi:C-C chemokine receptor type 5 [Pangasianodon hypophthalmus]|uniref:C-C chemokine receptor type 5 n=1 Tax=Pangasianodon hypophthalmus TaxID=310915 RepID=UPI00147D4CC5|nr:C-C chemokine receptor type 5 [Pangasianodon hypophthalmus]
MFSINSTTPLTYTRMKENNVTDYQNDSYEYDYGDLITHCHLEKYDQITGVSYIAICCFSFLGNGMLLYALARFEDLKRVTMLFLLFLAFFDLLFTLTLPFWAVDHLKEWIFGDIACKILTGAYFVGIYGSLILLTAMTVDCFFFIVVRSQWFTRRRRLNCARAAFAGSWIISVGACLKEALSSEVKNVNSVHSCDTVPSPDDQAGYYTQFVMLFAIPLVIIILCYAKILHTLMSSSGQRRYKTLLVVLLIIMAFVVCWGPYHIVIILMPTHRNNDCAKERQLQQTFVACRILAYFHCCINPLLFLIRGRSRKILSRLLFCQPQHRRFEPSDRSSDPSHFNIHQHFSMAIPQNVTELKSL